MRPAAPVRAAVVLALLAVPAGALAGAGDGDDARPLTFSAGADGYAVPADGFASLGWQEAGGMELCFTAPVEAAVAAFTARNRGAVVRVAIGETEVTRVRLVEPYAGGCITWPIHPVVAANYIAMLRGGPPGAKEGGGAADGTAADE